MKRILILVLICAISWAALDQKYEQTFDNQGLSTITKSFDISIFSATLSDDMLNSLENNCKLSPGCSFNRSSKQISISEKLGPKDGYYQFSADYGFPFTTYTIKIDRIPNDRFSADVTRMMGIDEGSYQATDLNEDNSGTAMFLKKFRANATYKISSPIAIDEAAAGPVAGEINGNSATFDLLQLMNQKGPIVLKAHELNLTYIIILAGIIAVGAIALSFKKSGKSSMAEKEGENEKEEETIEASKKKKKAKK
ncbi:hypothetical protein HY988_03345 [Candidatus Micrarchaeota archaeon]|nr:hypothetical protein [Candidatus Micrarchaeota archaeon]